MKMLFFEKKTQMGTWSRCGGTPVNIPSVVSGNLKSYLKQNSGRPVRCVDKDGRLIDILM